MKFLLAVLIFILSLSNVTCAESSEDFCWKYFATLNHEENIFYSPYGIRSALSIMANGAKGDTQQEILSILGAESIKSLNAEYKKFSDVIEEKYSSENVFMESNLLLVDKKIIGRGFNKNFQRVVNKIYKSDLRQANFENELDEEKEKISNWVVSKTDNFIPNYDSIIKKETLTDLLNVVYFKGEWTMPFSLQKTSLREFKNRDGAIKEVDMMQKTFNNAIVYTEDEKFKGIKLNYGDEVAMYLILPLEDNDLNVAELWNEETSSYRADFLDTLRTSPNFDGNVIVRLPKFELDIENNLIDKFKAMGLEKAFADDADFSNIVKGMNLKMDNAKHRAKIKVDEQGTEAAAVTEIGMVRSTSATPNLPRRVFFFAERPFLFVIGDIESGKILFTGVVNNL